MLRMTWEEQRRFPLKVATTLSQQFGGHGLQFFKVNRTVTHVSVARPHYLDMEATPVSEGVKRIVDFINANPKCTRRKLVDALAPTPAPAPAPTSAPGAVAPVAGAPAQEATPEQTALASDLHWLIHQGHVIEFANGILETAKKPLPRPPKPEKKQDVPGATAAPSTSPPVETPVVGTSEEVADQPVAVSAPDPVPEAEPAVEEATGAIDAAPPENAGTPPV
jgi:hypothetical protein